MKTEHIQKQLDFFVRDKSHHAYRKPAEDPHALAAQFAAQGLDDMQRSVGRLRYVLAQETPVVFPDERITLLRTVRTIPEIHTEEEDRKLHETHAFHENGRVFNMCPDYGMLMADGFTKKAEKIRAQLEAAQTPEQKEFLQAMLDVLDLVTAFAARYREEAASATRPSPTCSPGSRPTRPGRFSRRCSFCACCTTPCGATATTTIPSAALTSSCIPITGMTWMRAC